MNATDEATGGSAPAAGGWLYVEDDLLKYKNSSGDVTVLGPSD